jgi:hypothetical protein
MNIRVNVLFITYFQYSTGFVLFCIIVYIYIYIWLYVLCKVKVPRNRLESPDGGRGIALYSLDLGATRGRVVSTTPRLLYPRERPGTSCTGGWVGLRAGLDVCGKSRSYRNSILGPYSP